MLLLLVFFPLISHSGETSACAPDVIGYAQVRPVGAKVFARLRSGCADRTTFGLFVYDVEKGRWETAGAAANFSEPIAYNGVRIDPNAFFYARGGYESIQLVNITYAISVRDGRVVVTASGLDQSEYASEIVAEGTEPRQYLFTYMRGTALWFDMRVRGDTAYSEGVGRFDTADGSFRFYPAAALGFDPGRTVITRVSGFGGNVALGTSVCAQDNCLERGAVVFIPENAEEKPSIYTSENAAIPSGAVLDIEPDGTGLWVAAAHGVTLWYPDKKKNVIYMPAINAFVNGPAKLRLCAYCLVAENATVPHAASATVAQLTDGGFLVSLAQQIPAWTKMAADFKFEDNGKTIVIEPGQKIAFRETGSPASPLMGELLSSTDAVKFPVLDRNGDSIRVDLSSHVWLAQTEIVFSMQRVR